MQRGRMMAAVVVLGGLGTGVAAAAVVEDPGPRGVVPRTGSWKGTAKTADGRIYPLTFRVARTGGRLEVRDLVTKGPSTCVEDDGSTSRTVVTLTVARAVVRTRGELSGVWSVVTRKQDVDGKFRPSTRMTGAFRVVPTDVSCSGPTVFLQAHLAVPSR